MDVTILGAGKIGGTLCRKWAGAGHKVTLGVRDPKTVAAQAFSSNGNSTVTITDVAGAVASGNLIVFAVPYNAVEAVARANAGALRGKMLVDATNNFSAPVINNVATLQNEVGDAAIYRALNSLGYSVFAEPQVAGVAADHFFCGADGVGRQQVEALIEATGLRPVWVGGLEQVELVDRLGLLWVQLVFRQRLGPRLAFKMLTE